MSAEINLYAAWIGMLLGGILGAVQGVFFHNEEWMGGYGSWKRRMTRLGHISFFGIAFINIAFVATVNTTGIEGQARLPSVLFIIGAIGMPLICYLSAFIKNFRHLFFIPALSVIAGIASLLWIVYYS
ncbi:MAG: hypothetical protein HKN52_07135 [Eudoraea sp.]|nr:hypothetical protein [Muriicola sp.]NNE02923.1 hypothetical protein [Eudoraea sp.]NNL01115.1 hypothetical protein [Eudoraea sp.]